MTILEWVLTWQASWNISGAWNTVVTTWWDWYNNIEEFRLIIWALFGLVVFVVISYFLLRRSRDRCMKEFENYHVEAILLSDQEGDLTRYAYSGVLEVPIQAGNGFEVNYDLEAIDNLPQLFSYLKTAERYTGNSKYSRTIQSIHERLTKVNRLDLESEYSLNPFDPPPEASHKVYQQDLERLLAIVRFFDELPEVEMRARLAAMEKFFHPGFLRRTTRAIGNFVSFAWDRVKQIGTMITGYFTKARTADMQKVATEAQTTAFAYTPRKYEALLENSIGYLVKAKVISPDGRIRFYRGVLKEYSDNYICLYNVYYRLPRAGDYEDCRFLGLDKTVMHKVHGKPVTRDQDFEISCDDSGKILRLKNISGHHAFLGKVEADGQALSGFRELILPDGIETLALPAPPKRIRLEYEEAFPSDVVLPRRLAIIMGRAEPKILSIEKLKKFAGRVKKLPVSNIKDFQSKLFATTESTETISREEEEEVQALEALPPEPKE